MTNETQDRRFKPPSDFWLQNDRREQADRLYSPFQPRRSVLPMKSKSDDFSKNIEKAD